MSDSSRPRESKDLPHPTNTKGTGISSLSLYQRHTLFRPINSTPEQPRGSTAQIPHDMHSLAHPSIEREQPSSYHLSRLDPREWARAQSPVYPDEPAPQQSPETQPYPPAIQANVRTDFSSRSSLRAQSFQSSRVHDASPYNVARPKQTSDGGTESSSIKEFNRRLDATPFNSLLDPETQRALKNRINKSKKVLEGSRKYINNFEIRNNMIRTINLLEQDVKRSTHDTSLRIKKHEQKIESLGQERRLPEINIEGSKKRINELNKQISITGTSTLLNQEQKKASIASLHSQISHEEDKIKKSLANIPIIENRAQREQELLEQARNDEAQLAVSNVEIQAICQQLKKSSLPPQTSDTTFQVSSNQPDTSPSRDTDKTREVPQHPEPTSHFGNQAIAEIFPKVDLNRISNPTKRNAYEYVLHSYSRILHDKAMQTFQSDPACQHILDHYNASQIYYKWYGSREGLTELIAMRDIRDRTISVGPSKESLRNLGITLTDQTKHLYEDVDIQEVSEHLQRGGSVQWAVYKILRPVYKQTEEYQNCIGSVGLYLTDNHVLLTRDFGGSNTGISGLFNTNRSENHTGPWTRPEGAVKVQPHAKRGRKSIYGNVERWQT